MAYGNFRTANVFKIGATNTPQPLFGSWVTAGTGFTAPSNTPLTLTLGTAQNAGNDAAQIFIPGEAAWLIDPNGANGEAVIIKSISGNTVTLGQQTLVNAAGQTGIVTANAHVTGALGTGTFIIPKQILNNFIVTFEDGGTGTFLYIGNSPAMTAILHRIFKLAKTASGVQPQYYAAGMFSPGNVFDASGLWVYGTANDLYNVAMCVE